MIRIWKIQAAIQAKGTAKENAPARDCRETKRGDETEGASGAETDQER